MKIKIICKTCKKEFEVHNYRKNNVKYCSYKCYWISKKEETGSKSHFYKGGWIDEFGYKRKQVNKKMIREHRLVVENKIGRKLTSDEIVHHINENKQDNRIENLQIMTRSDHAKLHKFGEKNYLGL